MRITYFVAITLLLSGVVCFAATFTDNPLVYVSKNSNGEINTITFPHLVSDRQDVADRINRALHDQILRTVLRTPAKDQRASPPSVLFANQVAIESMSSGGISTMNGGRTIAVFIEGETCGAHCDAFSEQLNYDAQTGRALIQAEIVSAKGELGLAAIAIKAHTSVLAKKISALKKLASKNAKDVSRIKDQIALYETCLHQFVKGDETYDSNASMAWPGSMQIHDGELTFSQGACASHAERALDDLENLSITLKADKLRPYLTNYGRYLLLGEGDGAMPAINPYSQIFHGTINGSIPVTLFLGGGGSGLNDSSFSDARYYYDKYGKPISLSLHRNGNTFELTEHDAKGSVSGVLKFQAMGGRLLGQWTGNGKTFPFEANP